MYRSAIPGCGSHSRQRASVHPAIGDATLAACRGLDGEPSACRPARLHRHGDRMLDDDATASAASRGTRPVMWWIFAAPKSARVGFAIPPGRDSGFFPHSSCGGGAIEAPAGVTDNDPKALGNRLPR